MVDFVCFTDNPQLQFSSGNWNIRPIPSELRNLPKVKQQRVLKACPHKYLPEYDISIWVDGNLTILCDVMKFIQGYDMSKIKLYTRKHPARTCIYKEAQAVVKFHKDIPANIKPQVDKYKGEGFPVNFGLHETCVILREHNNREVQLFDNMWASQILKYSHRDQMSFDYCRWKCNLTVGHLKIGQLTKDNNFRWRPHGK